MMDDMDREAAVISQADDAGALGIPSRPLKRMIPSTTDLFHGDSLLRASTSAMVFALVASPRVMSNGGQGFMSSGHTPNSASHRAQLILLESLQRGQYVEAAPTTCAYRSDRRMRNTGCFISVSRPGKNSTGLPSYIAGVGRSLNPVGPGKGNSG